LVEETGIPRENYRKPPTCLKPLTVIEGYTIVINVKNFVAGI
jgi:hypothetical protein